MNCFLHNQLTLTLSLFSAKKNGLELYAEEHGRNDLATTEPTK